MLSRCSRSDGTRRAVRTRSAVWLLLPTLSSRLLRLMVGCWSCLRIGDAWMAGNGRPVHACLDLKARYYNHTDCYTASTCSGSLCKRYKCVSLFQHSSPSSKAGHKLMHPRQPADTTQKRCTGYGSKTPTLSIPHGTSTSQAWPEASRAKMLSDPLLTCWISRKCRRKVRRNSLLQVEGPMFRTI